jgi:hypothetical protein
MICYEVQNVFCIGATVTVRPLCYCRVLARVRYAWTTSNSARKWYGCENYKAIFEIKIVLYFVHLSYAQSFLPLFFHVERW